MIVIKRLISVMMTLVMALISLFAPNTSTTPVEKERPSAGSVTEYCKEEADYSLEIDASEKLHEISDMLFGVFFEDINFAADGGLYAEMVQNRSFEFNELAENDEKHAWLDVGDVSAQVTKNDVTGGLNENNPNYMVIKNDSGEKGGIENTGYLDGMYIRSGASYTFSFYAKSESYNGKVYAMLKAGDDVAAAAEFTGISDKWQKYTATLTSDITSVRDKRDVTLALLIDDGEISVDMISLIPQDSVFDLRADLVEALKELQPKFLRFPGGCVIEGHSLELAYDWKESVGTDRNGDPFVFNGKYGDVAARKQGQNIWTDENQSNDRYPSFMSYGLGFYEYFLLSEYIGAVGVPVLNCGICCMGRGEYTEYTEIGSQQQEYYVQSMLDLIEFCRGDETTKWGKARIEMGHKEPFELKYVGIGNEQWGQSFYDHYETFVDALIKAKEEKPEIYDGVELIYSAGVDDGASGNPDYPISYKNAQQWLADNPDRELSEYAGAIDQHYYNAPNWFLSHTDYYDEANYSRDTEDFASSLYGGGIPAFVGEYAALSNTWKAGLAEAAYMTGLERNGDIVCMAAYAPLFGNGTANHWSPNLIWFNNDKVTKSVDYYVQQVFSINQGKYVLQHKLVDNEIGENPDLSGKIGLATWRTKAIFDDVLVTDNATGKVLAYDGFERFTLGSSWEKISGGSWMIINGRLYQNSKSTDIDKYNNWGDSIYFGDTDWSNYTFSVTATKTDGHEGFIIPFAVGDKDNNYMWNIGGWWNTKSALQKTEAGCKSFELTGTEKEIEIKTGVPYRIKVVVSGRNIKGYINNELYIDYDAPVSTVSDVYSVVSTDDTGDTIIKLVNVCDESRTVCVNIKNATRISSVAEVYEVIGNSPDDDNYLWADEAVTMEKKKLSGVSSQFNYTVAPYSVIVIRISG